jgi:two-component system chemotaxis response regulator CheB
VDTNKIRLLVAEDSAYMQMAIRTMVKIDPSIQIVGEVKDGSQAVEVARLLKPDIITMDVNMPGLNGIDASRRIMTEAPSVILMFSTTTDKGVARTLQALEAGATDYLSKSSSAGDMDLSSITTQLATRIRFWGLGARPYTTRRMAVPTPTPDTDLLVITGGAGSALAIGALLRDLGPVTCPVVVSHDDMASEVTLSLIDYIARTTRFAVREGGHRAPLAPGAVTVMPAGRDARVRRDEAGRWILDFHGIPPGCGPNFLRSATAAAARLTLACLSGGARQLAALAPSFAEKPVALWIQDPAECAVPDLVAEALALAFPHMRLTSAPMMPAERAA